ncbi:MAG TPA: condensation domain-containing protein [Streptosporangiaceae bacterium]|jgi:hypothetical protein
MISTAWTASIGQERHFGYQRRFPSSAAFNVPIGATWRGPADLGALEEAIRAVTARHDTMRSSFGQAGGLLRAQPQPESAIPVTRHDLRGLGSDAARGAALAEIGATEAATPFDLSGEPATRAHLVRLADDEAALVLNVHHVSFDGWSSPVFFAELADQYRARTEGRPARRSEPEDVYADFAMAQRKRLRAGGYDAQLGFWRDALARPAPPASWPDDGRDPGAPWWAGDMAWASVPQDLVAAVRDAATAARTTLFGWTLAVFQVALHRFLDARAVGVGTPYAARADPRWQELVGFFANTLVMGSELDGGETFAEAVARCRAATMLGHQQQDVPFGVVIDALKPPVEPDRTPYFQAMFIVQNTPLPPAEFGGLRLRTTKIVTGSARYDMTFCLGWRRGELALELETRPALLGQEAAVRFARLFFGLLAASVHDPDTKVGRAEPEPVPIGVRRGRERAPGVDGLFEGLVGDWRKVIT